MLFSYMILWNYFQLTYDSSLVMLDKINKVELLLLFAFVSNCCLKVMYWSFGHFVIKIYYIIIKLRHFKVDVCVNFCLFWAVMTDAAFLKKLNKALIILINMHSWPMAKGNEDWTLRPILSVCFHFRVNWINFLAFTSKQN